MKRFKVEGWYRLHDEKDFEQLIIEVQDYKTAIDVFLETFKTHLFYIVTAKEIRLTEMQVFFLFNTI